MLRRDAILACCNRIFPHIDPHALYAEAVAHCWRHVTLAVVRPDTRAAVTPGQRKLVADALARGKGLLLLSAHTGLWELLPRVLLNQVAPACKLAVVYKPLRCRPLDAIVAFLRARGLPSVTGIHVTDPRCFDRLREHLRLGHAVALLNDVRASKSSRHAVTRAVLGRDCRLNTSFVHLARLSGAPTLFVTLAGDLQLRVTPIKPSIDAYVTQWACAVLARPTEYFFWHSLLH